MARRPRCYFSKTRLITLYKRLCFICCPDESAEGTNHCQDAGNVALIKGMYGDTRSKQIGRDRRLQVGKSENKVRLKPNNLRDIRRGEGRDTRFLAPHLRRTDRIAGYTDNAMLFPKKI